MMDHTMQLARQLPTAAFQPIGEALDSHGVTEFMNDFELGGIVRVEPIQGHAPYAFIVTFAFDGEDAAGDVTYLTTFDPRVEFPNVPRRSAPLSEPV